MTLEQTISADIISAMKSGDALKRDVLRSVKADITNWKVAQQKEPQDSDVIALIKKGIKQRQEAAELYKTGDRVDMADKELSEAEVLKPYMPTQMTNAEIAPIVKEIIDSVGAEQSNMGQIMGQIKARLGDSADMGLVSKLVRDSIK